MILKKVGIMYLHDHQWKKKLSTAAHSDVCTLEGRLTDWREITEPQILIEVQMQRDEIIKEPSPFT